jgi:hypothetical protein
MQCHEQFISLTICATTRLWLGNAANYTWTDGRMSYTGLASTVSIERKSTVRGKGRRHEARRMCILLHNACHMCAGPTPTMIALPTHVHGHSIIGQSAEQCRILNAGPPQRQVTPKACEEVPQQSEHINQEQSILSGSFMLSH